MLKVIYKCNHDNKSLIKSFDIVENRSDMVVTHYHCYGDIGFKDYTRTITYNIIKCNKCKIELIDKLFGDWNEI
jgi:hypothetical protein